MKPPRPSPALVLALGCLAAAAMIGGSLINRGVGPGPSVRVLMALVPMIPVWFLGWSIAAAVRGLDELQRRIVLEAIFGAFLAGAFLTLLYGQLQHARVGFPELNWAFVWVAMIAPCTIAYLVAARRYR